MVGIYMIVNLITNKTYIGKSINIDSRWKSHISNLKTNKHINKDLQLDWNKFGESNFSFKVLEYCSEDLLSSRERHWIDIFNSKLFGYNFNNNLAIKDRVKIDSKIKTNSLEYKILNICNSLIKLSDYCMVYYEDLCEYLEVDKARIKKSVKKINYNGVYIDVDYSDYDSEGLLFYKVDKKYKGNSTLYLIEDLLKI